MCWSCKCMALPDIDYVMQHTKILYVPYRRIDSFGDTRYNFRLVSEPMDEVGTCRIRSGWVECSRPRIIKPADLCSVEMEGFSVDSRRLFEQWRHKLPFLPVILKYGFNFCRSEVETEVVHEDIRNVSDRLKEAALTSGDPLLAVIEGDDGFWEISLLYFVMEIVSQSYEINTFDFKRRGLM